MALIVSSILSTWPCFTPLELALPKPSISSLPNSFLRPAITAILVVPMSSPTIMGCSLFIVLVFSCFYLLFLSSRSILFIILLFHLIDQLYSFVFLNPLAAHFFWHYRFGLFLITVC